MAQGLLTVASIKPHLVRKCGYRDENVQTTYEFARDKSIDLAAFAHQPFDARSACIAVIDCKTSDPKSEVLDRRDFGAPIIFVCFRDSLQVWKPGPIGAECMEPGLSAGQVAGFFEANKSELAPRRVYDAKTLGRLPGLERQRSLFVDSGLLPYAEREIGQILTDQVVHAVDVLERSFADPKSITNPQQEWVLKSTFRLLAAKVLKDKRVPGFIRLDLEDLKDVFDKIQSHYGSDEKVDLGGPARKAALLAVASSFGQLGNLQNLTAECLSDVYERALVSKDTRKLRDTHGTPAYLVDYVVGQLAPWIEKIPTDKLRVFEPACGHAPFLVAALRLLKGFDLGMSGTDFSKFCRQRFSGIENDQFALEIAKLALTDADVPNRNGWSQLKLGNMFAEQVLENEARRTTVFLANPPFRNEAAFRMLKAALPNLPAGAVFGVIVPTALFYTKDPNKKDVSKFRKWLLENCQLAEVSLFPDGLFEFADQEITVMLGRRLKRPGVPPTAVRCRRVRENDKELFKTELRFQPERDRVFPQARFALTADCVPWVPELEDEVWYWLRNATKLEQIADVGQGMQAKSKKNLPAGSKTIEPSEFPGSIAGYAIARGDWGSHGHPPLSFFNLDPRVIRRPLHGTAVDKPQVLIVRNPVRGIWRLKPFVDDVGRPFASNFFTVRSKELIHHPLEFMFALCCSAIANAFVFTHSLKRNIQDGDLRQMPVPDATRAGIRRVVVAVRKYLAAATSLDLTNDDQNQSLFQKKPKARVTLAVLHDLLRSIDAEVLRLYCLPAKAERKLLDQFRDEPVRPGVRGDFGRYFPDDFNDCVPLYAYLTETFQTIRAGKANDVSEQQRLAYDKLVEKRSMKELTSTEDDELYRLQAEYDGRDFALRRPDRDWLDEVEKEQKEQQQHLDQLAERLLTANERREASAK